MPRHLSHRVFLQTELSHYRRYLLQVTNIAISTIHTNKLKSLADYTTTPTDKILI